MTTPAAQRVLKAGTAGAMWRMNGQPGRDGRVPFAFRVGVTGHRTLDNPASLARAAGVALRMLRTELLPDSAASWVVPVVVSALAEGADRLVAKEILAENGARLEAVLPLPRDDYLGDFAEEDSKQEFMDLLARAGEIWQAPPSASRDEAYERAGHRVVDRSDALIALWDGDPARGRGGTAGIVQYARDRGVPLVVVSTRDETLVYEPGDERVAVIRAAARKLSAYNAGLITGPAFRRQARGQRTAWGIDAAAGQAGPAGLPLAGVADWLTPFFVRADALSVRFQRRFRALSFAMFAMAAAAVTVVAVQVNFLPGMKWMVGLEVILLVGLFSLPLLNRHWQLHDRWISYRFLAERLRSGYFLALAGTSDRTDRAGRLDYVSDSSETWIERALAEVMARRPAADFGQADIEAIREYLDHYWIKSQIDYHNNAAGRKRTWDTRLTAWTAGLFGITLIAAFLHMLGIGEPGAQRSFTSALLIVLSISVPAIGAAVHGIGAQSQFRRHSERYSRMARLLTQLDGQMRQAESLGKVAEIAAETERIMREESNDWFGVMRFYDVDLLM
jgi:hypothetical protein